MKTLIRCGWLVSMDPKVGNLREAELLVEDDRIAAVGRNLGAKADREIDARGMIAMPGLVNAHLHTFQAAMRGLGTEWTAPDYFRLQAGDMSTRYQPEDNYLGNLVGALLAGLFLGVAEGLTGFLWKSEWAPAISVILLLAILVIFPKGLGRSR